MNRAKKGMALCAAIVVLLMAVPFAGLTASANTGNQREDIMEIAASQVGYHEYGDNGNKYGEYFGRNYISWCALFVSWCARQAGVPQSALPTFSSCTSGGLSFFKANGQFRVSPGYGGSYVPQRGDVIFYSDEYTTSSSSHVGLVDYVSGSNVYTIEGNYSDSVSRACFSLYDSYVIGFGTPAYEDNSVPDIAAPMVSDVRITDRNADGYTVHCTVLDDTGVTSVMFPTWTVNNGQNDLIWLTGSVEGNIASCRVNLADFGSAEGLYVTHVYAYDKIGQYGFGEIFQQVDPEAPVMTGISVSALSTDGYTITCTVSDNVLTTAARLPTWTEANGQDDLDAAWATSDFAATAVVNNTVAYTVRAADHNNEGGWYHTHIYLYDAYGNARCYPVAVNLNTGEYRLPAGVAEMPPYTAPTTGQAARGDVSGDGQVNMVDACLAFQYAAGQIDLTPPQQEQAAVLCRDGVDMGDVAALFQYSSGLMKTFFIR